MEITIKNKAIKLRYTIKGLIIFETIKAQSNIEGNLFATITLIWSFLRAELDRMDSDLELTLEEFVDWVDEGPNRFGECVDWLNKEQDRQTELLGGEKKSQV